MTDEAMEAKKTDVDLFIKVMNIFLTGGMSIDQIYWFTGSLFCRFATSINRPLEQIIADIEVTFKSLPPPIEENDESHQ